jgi:hypothetical protein
VRQKSSYMQTMPNDPSSPAAAGDEVERKGGRP